MGWPRPFSGILGKRYADGEICRMPLFGQLRFENLIRKEIFEAQIIASSSTRRSGREKDQ